MTKKAKPVNFASFTKAELIKTIKTLNKRQTQLLNEIAALKKFDNERITLKLTDAGVVHVVHVTQEPAPTMPWQLPNPYEDGK